MYAIFMALASMFCAACNDFLFKLYARRGGAVGVYLALIGLIWALFFAILSGLEGGGSLNAPTLFWGLISGVFSILANILLVVGMARMGVVVAATIYRLNLAPAAVLAVVFLGESVSLAKIMAVTCAVGAVMLICRPPDNAHPSAVRVVIAPNGTARLLDKIAGEKEHYRAGMIMVILACLLRAGMGVTYKAGLMQGADAYVILTLNGVVWMAGGLLYHLFAERRRRQFGAATWAFGAGSGILVCGIVWFLMLALQRGEASVVLPTAQLSFVVTSLLGVFLLKEAFPLRKTAGIGLACLCVLLLAMAV